VIRRPALLLVVAALALARPAAAQPAAAPGEAPDPVGATDVRQVAGPPRGSPLAGDLLARRTAEIAALLRCPVCQGMSIADSPASLARQMKELVGEMLAAGYDEAQITAYFEHSYGEFVLLRPPVRGIGALLWLSPLAVLLLAGGVLAWRIRRPAGRRQPAAPSPIDRPEPGASPSSEVDELAPYLEGVRRMTSVVAEPPAAPPAPECE
jgi:cytochrome c-type biogenesis protein CcmH